MNRSFWLSPWSWLIVTLVLFGRAPCLIPLAVGARGGEKEASGDPKDYDALLEKYVKGDYFDYTDLLKNKDDLGRFDAFLRWQATAKVKEMARDEQVTFYINAYNSCCIKHNQDID